MNLRLRIARIVVATAAVLGLAVSGVVLSGPAYAAGDSVTITPTSKTTPSNTVVTYTLAATCSTTCDATTTVTIPTGTVTNDGTTTDFGAWLTTPRTCSLASNTGGLMTFAFPTLGNGSASCTFSLRAPNKTTRNGAVATITPTINTAGGSTPAATPAVLTLASASSGHNDSLGASVNGNSVVNVFSGAPMTFAFVFNCGTGSGDLGLSPNLNISDHLPANFTFSGLTTSPLATNLQGTITTPAVGSSGGTITYTGDGSDCDNPANNRITFTVSGTASTNGTPDAVGGPQICNSGITADFTYVDGFAVTGAVPSVTPCATVVEIDFTGNKGTAAGTYFNGGPQYLALDGSTQQRYTFPGDWDATGGDTTFAIAFSSKPAIANAGLSYAIQDPLPCADTASGASNAYYVSKAPGATCATPAFAPKVITASGFTPAAGATITLRYSNGTTTTVGYVTGTGWTMPASPLAVSEVDFPAFPQEGTNSAATMSFTMAGFVPASITPGHVLTNTATTSAYFSGTTNQVKTAQIHSANILVADPAQTVGGVPTSGTVAYPSLTAQQAGTTCSENVSFNSTTNGTLSNQMEFAQAQSAPVYFDYLAPSGVTAADITGTTTTFTFNGPGGHSFTSPSIVPAATADYNGSGRTLLEWTIPAGVVTTPGKYSIRPSANTFSVALPLGCAGAYQNNLSIGYGAPLTECLWDNYVSALYQRAPMQPPTGDTTLGNLSAPANYCAYNAPLSIAPILPGYTVNKTVQGDLDAAPVGGIGKVSPSNGSATYTVTFRNNGQANLHDPVMYDILPTASDDTEATTTTTRGSQFPVVFAGVITTGPLAIPAGMTVQYSTSSNPCRPEVLADASNPGCTDTWSATPPAQLSDVTALRFFYDGTVGVPGSTVYPTSFSVSYSVTTTAATNGAIAWNSVGTSVHKGDTGPATATDDLMAAAESPRTGLTVSNDVPQIVKATSTPTFTQVGDQVQYTFDVTNNAGADLPSVTVADAFTDAPAGATPPTVTCDSVSGEGSCTDATTAAIPSGETAHFVATYVVTQADLDHGSLVDVATATGTTAGGGTISNTSNAVTVSATAVHDFTLQKSATPTVVSDTSTTITYSFVVDNNGNQAVHGVTVTDPMLTDVSCPSTTIAAGASETCTGTYTPTQADLDAGEIDNTATAGALDPANGAVGDTSSFTVDVTQHPSLTLTKSATPVSVAGVGDSVDYAFHVVNDGNVTMSAVTVTESAFSGSGAAPAVDCPAGPITLAPGDVEDCTASYLVTQADLDAGSITNTATADGTDPAGASLTDPSTSSAAVSVVQTASLTLTETVDAPKATAAGQVLHYTFHVENTGNVSITGLTVQETGFTGTGGAPSVTCPTTTLAPGDATDCTASYTVQTADLKLARIDNPASATGVTAGGSVTPATSTTEVIVDPPAIPPLASALAATGVVANVAYGIVSAIGLLGLGLVLLILRRRRSA